MSMNLITGHAGMPHVTSAQQGACNAAIFSKDRYVLNIGSEFSFEILSNNLIRVNDGLAINQGRFMGIDVDNYEEMTIDNGLQGVKRTDLIVIRYEKNAGTGIETATMEVIKGESGAEYTDPEYIAGNILSGDLIDAFPLYRVKINGLNIDSVEPLFEIRKPVDISTFQNRGIFAGDIDTLRGLGKSGSYWVQPASKGTTSASDSMPFGPDVYFDLHVFVKNTTDATQMAVCYETNGRNDVRYRMHVNGKWHPWSTRLGTVNISGIGDGSVTGAISAHAGTAASATVPGHTKFGTAAGTACQGNDSRLSNARTPIAHASAATTYGVGNASNYGHVKLSDTYTSSVGASASAIGASQAALYNAYDVLNKKFGGYLPLTGGVLNGNIDLMNGRSVKTQTTTGVNTVLLVMNNSNSIHMGDYNGANGSPVYLHAKGVVYDFLQTTFRANGDANATINIGDASHLWKNVYSRTGTIQTSDRTKKHDICDISEVYEQLFLKLQPKSFVFNDGDRIHIGAISQDVEDVMTELGIEPEQFAGFCRDIRYEYTEYNEEDGTPVESSKVPCRDENGDIIYDYALRYQEFIFLTVHMTQRLWKKADALEAENAELKERMEALEEKVNTLIEKVS